MGVLGNEGTVPREFKPYLLTVSRSSPDVVPVLQQHTIPVHFKLDEWYIAGADDADIAQLEKAGIGFKVIDTEAWSNPYYFISRAKSKTIDTLPDVGKVVFQQDTEALVKIAHHQRLELVRSGFQLTSISEKPLPLVTRKPQKITMAILSKN